MPLRARGNLPVNFVGYPSKDVLDPVVKGMEDGSSGGQFYGVRRMLLSAFEQISVDRQQLIDLTNLQGYLSDQFLIQGAKALLVF